MKKIIILALLIGLIPTIFSCGSRNGGADGTETVAVSDTEEKNDMKNKVEQWVAAEIKLTSGKDYGDPVYDVNVDCIFKNTETGTSYSSCFLGRQEKLCCAIRTDGDRRLDMGNCLHRQRKRGSARKNGSGQLCGIFGRP